MRKYLLHVKHRPKADQFFIQEPSLMLGTQVYPQEQEPFFIGVYGPDGLPIYAMQDRVKIGFCSQKLNLD